MSPRIPQDKEDILIRVTARGYTAQHTLPGQSTMVMGRFFPDIDSLLNWLADHLAVPGA